MTHRDNKERSHIFNTNAFSLFAAIIFTVTMGLYHYSSGNYTQLTLHLMLCLIAIILLLLIFIFTKTLEQLAFFIPASVATMLMVGAFVMGGLSYLFIVFAALCSLCGTYLCLRAFFWFIVYLNAMLFLSIVVLRFPITGGDSIGSTYYEGWILLWFCMLGVYITVRHVTNRHSASGAAMTSFSTMLASTPNMVALVDELNRVTFISDEFIKLVNIESFDYAVGRPIFDLLPNDDVVEMIANALDNSEDYESTAKVFVNGEEKYYKVIFVQMGQMGTDEKVKLIDITDVTPLVKARDEAEKASLAKSGFLSKMSHEIRTPMNAVLGMAELILREKISAPAMEQALTIKQSGEHLLSIINDILDFSKIESGKMEIVESEYLFHSTVNDVVNIIKMRHNNPQVKFAIYMEHTIPNELVGDEVRIRQVMLNILTNSLKYTEQGSFTLDIVSERLDNSTIMLAIKIKDTGIGIAEADMKKLFTEFSQFDQVKNRKKEGTGLGLPITNNLVKLMGGTIEVKSVYGKGSEFIICLPQKLNEKYHNSNYANFAPNFSNKNVLLYGKTPIYTEYAARSLSDLNVNYRIINTDKELISCIAEKKYDYVFAEDEIASTAKEIIESQKLSTKIIMMCDAYQATEGNNFSILVRPVYFLSVTNALNGGDMFHTTNVQSLGQFTAPGAKIMLVDDINTNLKVGEGLLKAYGVQTILCSSGQGALDALETEEFDLILMDHMMPEMDGVEAVQIIRKTNKTLPIVALTANAIVGAREMFLANGFDDFLSKPIELAKLNSILSKWIPKDKQIQSSIKAAKNNNDTISIIIDGVNTARGISMSGGDIDSYLDTLTIFHKDGLTKIDEIKRCVETENLSLFITYTHALKSACANIGANVFSDEAKKMEKAGNNHEIDYIIENIDDFISRLQKLLDGVLQAINQHISETQAPVNLDNYKDILEKLKTALESFDVSSIDELSDELKAFTTHPDVGETIDNILQDAFVGKYKQALEQISGILK